MSRIEFESGAVQSYLSILQGVINRMAGNSASCKTWCVTLVSAIVVIVADKSRPELISVAVLPIVLFLFLDAYYLGLEQRFRGAYNRFIKKLHDANATIDDVYIVDPGSGFLVNAKSVLGSLFSLSIWPFYLLLALMLVVIRRCVL